MKASPLTVASPVPIAPMDGERRYELAPSLVCLTRELDPTARAVRATAAEIASRHVERGHRGLAVCGVSPGVGASFMTANIAIALSDAGISTLVVDANLQRPSLDALFRPEHPSVGLRQVLGADALGLSDVVHAEVLPNLSLVYAGLADGQGEDKLIGSEQFADFARVCLREYTCTLFDVAAANQASDARRVAAVVGYALVVTRRNLTFARDVSLFLNELSFDGAQVIGSVLNDA